MAFNTAWLLTLAATWLPRGKGLCCLVATTTSMPSAPGLAE